MSTKRRRARQRTLAIDVGGSGVKAALLDGDGDMVSEKLREETPDHFTPGELLEMIERMARQLPQYDRVAVGIPGIVHRDVVYSLPASGSRAFKGYELGARLTELLGKRVRVTNDAAMHGLAAIDGDGVEMVITLGTGLGTALFIDGVLSAHYQTLPDQDEPFSAYGDAARKKIGRKRWEERVHALFDQLRGITNYDRLYVGGGNAERLKDELPPRVKRIDSAAGILGGHRLWEWGDVP
ncbi:MAG TPA: ROK family protein [Gemmatimonadaceae bacterium]|nr:ROK family protein [Gemmatimonadaceae bacterium]